jgi:TonB-linked SusC/RagA family outer membrane protein
MKSGLYLTMKGVLCFMLTLALSVSTAWAQDRRVTGKVTGPEGPIPGVNVALKGTTTGTTTNASGDYSITLRGTNPTLVISAIGYKSQEVVVGNQTSINVTLEEDALALGEVVVTGYTTDNRRETTGAVSTVKTRALTAVPSGNVEQQLQGRVAGVTVVTNGQPGTTSQVRVRGFGAFGGNAPLYVVDGVPVGGIDFINPDDVESTTVLKDAAAASIYGARAANGVIILTTRKGTREARKLTVTYDGVFGLTDPGRGQTMLTPQEQADWTWQARRNDAFLADTVPNFNDIASGQYGSGASPVLPDYINVGGRAGVIGTIDLEAERAKYNIDPTKGPVYQVVRANKAGTDWYGALTRWAPLQRHTLGFSGGGNRSRFYVGLSAQDQAGIMIVNNFKRYAFRVNTEFDVLKNLRIGQNMQLTYRQVLGQQGNEGGIGVSDDENDILQAFRMPPIIPVYDEFGGYAGTAARGFNNPRNPVANRDGLRSDRNFSLSAFGNFYAEFDPLPGLTLRSSLGGSAGNGYFWGYSRLQYENSENNSAFGTFEGGNYGFSWVLTNTAQYKKKFGVHSLDVLIGQEALNTGLGRNVSGSGQNPFSTDPIYVTLSNINPTSRQVGSGQFPGTTFYSLFTRANYAFKDKYILSAVVRRDGSSRFAPAYRFGVFPAFSAAWRVSAEPFMQDLTFISDLKIRGGYGTMGNSNNVNPNNQFSLFGASVGNSSYDIAGTNSSAVEGFLRTRIGNPFARWETAVTKNIGFDGTLFNGKLDVILDLWQKDTRDLIFPVPIPGVNGYFATVPDVNVGKMVNKGIDLQIISRGKLGREATYELNVTGGFLQNRIVELAPNINFLTNVDPSYRGINPIRNQIGQSISAFFGFQTHPNVLFRSQAEIDQLNEGAPRNPDGTPGVYQTGAAPGRFRYVDTNGDGRITPDDRTYLGSPVPVFTGGMNFRVVWKNFDVETYVYTSLGNKIFNVSKWFTDFYPSFTGAAVSARVKKLLDAGKYHRNAADFREYLELQYQHAV